MDLTPWIIFWAAVTTVVMLLAFYRLSLGMHEDADLHLNDDDPAPNVAQVAMAKRINRVETMGKSLTVVSVLLVLFIAGIWAFERLASMGKIVP